MQATDIILEPYAEFLVQDPSTGEVLVEVDMSPKAKHPTNGQQEMMQQIMFDPLKEVRIDRDFGRPNWLMEEKIVMSWSPMLADSRKVKASGDGRC